MILGVPSSSLSRTTPLSHLAKVGKTLPVCYHKHVKVVTLGTGSGRPTLRRNVSAVAVVWEGEWLLFDCGEATQIQMMKADLSISRLTAIFITHLHGDHFNGLAGLLSTIGLNGRDHMLTIVGPPGIQSYLDLLRELRVLYVNYPVEVREFPARLFSTQGVPTPASHIRAGATSGPSELLPLLCVFETDRYTVSSRPLDHRLYALGYRIEERTKPGRFDLERARALGIPEGPLFGRLQAGNEITLADGGIVYPGDVLGPSRPGRKMAYCTDTRPCQGSVVLSKEVDLMVHEATFAEDREIEASEYGHSTSAQAAMVAAQAGPGRLLITHISARYPDASGLLQEARARFPNSELAQDLMVTQV